MKRLIIAIAWGFIGSVAGYFIGVLIGCNWLLTSSNLCGIYGLLLGVPIGFILGAMFGWLKQKHTHQ